jgi:hypothetical protein
VGALSSQDVGQYLNASFVSTYQKVGTFRRVGDQKQGGNVASYLCTPDGQVLHVLIGPVNAGVLLREARWVVETWKLAQMEGASDEHALKTVFRKAHAERFRQQQRGNVDVQRLAAVRNLQSRVHLLLTLSPLVKLEKAYQMVFEDIVGEKVSTSPVLEAE